MRWIAAAVLVLLGFAVYVRADSPLNSAQHREVLAEAQRDYDRGITQLRSDPAAAKAAFQAAAGRFQLAADSIPDNGVLRYNLANAQLQSGDVGRAILNYRRAEKFIPGDARLRSNLDYARTLVRSQIAPSGSRSLVNAVLTWHHRTSTVTRWTIFVVCYAVLWLTVALRMWRPIGGLTAVIVICLILSIIVGASVAADSMAWGRTTAGVILNDDVTVRKGNGTGFELQFAQSLHSGTEFELLEKRGDWLDIRLPDDKTGWIEARATELVP